MKRQEYLKMLQANDKIAIVYEFYKEQAQLKGYNILPIQIFRIAFLDWNSVFSLGGLVVDQVIYFYNRRHQPMELIINQVTRKFY